MRLYSRNKNGENCLLFAKGEYMKNNYFLSKKIFSVVVIAVLIATCAICFVGCKKEEIRHPGCVLVLENMDDLNLCLGDGNLLPGTEVDFISVHTCIPYFSGSVEENINVITTKIEKVQMIYDDYDLHIKILMYPNWSNNDEVVVQDGGETLVLGGEKVAKYIFDENNVYYNFIDRKFGYVVYCDFKDTERVDKGTSNTNNKTFEENVSSMEKFIAGFKRYFEERLYV